MGCGTAPGHLVFIIYHYHYYKSFNEMSLKQGFEFKDLAYDVIRWHHIKFYNQYVLWNQYGNYYLYNIPYTITLILTHSMTSYVSQCQQMTWDGLKKVTYIFEFEFRMKNNRSIRNFHYDTCPWRLQNTIFQLLQMYIINS